MRKVLDAGERFHLQGRRIPRRRRAAFRLRAGFLGMRPSDHLTLHTCRSIPKSLFRIGRHRLRFVRRGGGIAQVELRHRSNFVWREHAVAVPVHLVGHPGTQVAIGKRRLVDEREGQERGQHGPHYEEPADSGHGKCRHDAGHDQ